MFIVKVVFTLLDGNNSDIESNIKIAVLNVT